jgi:hypothetical protein
MIKTSLAIAFLAASAYADAGANDTFRCNNAAGSGISVVSPNAAGAGTTTCAVGSVSIAYQGAVSCHLDTAAATAPLYNFTLGYVTP